MGLQKIRFYTTREELVNTIGTGLSLGLFYCAPLLSIAICLLVLYSPLYPLLFIYFLWMYIDRDTPHKDGRRCKWMCSLWIYKSLRRYFPQTLVKTVDLPPNRNYIFCLSPHGIVVTAGFAHFLTNDSEEFNKLFPGLKTSLHTLNSNFCYPIMREITLSCGWLTVSMEALLYQLRKPQGGRAVVLVPGGAAEAMISEPGTHRLVLKNRKGFIKLAIITGTSLVPIYAFGETDLYEHRIFHRGSLMFRVQEYIRKTLGIAPAIPFYGGGLFQNWFGLLPRPLPVTTVVGKPIEVKQNTAPTMEDVNALHEKYISELTNLFEDHKHKYITNARDAHLSIEEL